MENNIIHLDLFSGIGGFAYAIDQVYENTTHIFCEIDPFCQAVLKKHWPDSIIIDDIRVIADTRSQKPRRLSSVSRKTLYAAGITDKPFLLTGGFPCQPFSQAGRRKGTEDNRHLWPFMFETIRNWQPTWVIAENVRGILTIDGGMVFEQVCTDLESAGYQVQPLIIPAVAVNAPHRRDRIWFVAHSKDTISKRCRRRNNGHWTGTEGRIESEDKVTRCDSALYEDDANSERTRHQGQINKARPSSRHRRGSQPPDWTANWLEVATHLCGVDDGIPKRLDRNPRLKALGNAIVPQVAEEIIKAISLT